MPSADHKLNTLGLLCPLPLLFAVRDMASLEPGQILEIIGDDPGLYEDIPAWCERTGHRLLGFEEDEGVIQCWVEKGDTPDEDADLASDPEADQPPEGA